MPVDMGRVNQVSPVFQKENIDNVQLKEEKDISFSSVLKNAIEKVNETQKESDMKTEALAEGKVNDLHDVMITAQKANLTMETAVQIQQKVIDTYNEVMRMQV